MLRTLTQFNPCEAQSFFTSQVVGSKARGPSRVPVS